MDEDWFYAFAEAYECGVETAWPVCDRRIFLVKNLAEYVKKAKQVGYNYLFITTNRH